MTNDEILELKCGQMDFKHISIRQHLHELMSTLWEEGEGFSGKKPFGNSGWEYDLYKPLVIHGIVKGDVDEYGDIENFSHKECHRIIDSLIDHIFFPNDDSDE